MIKLIRLCFIVVVLINISTEASALMSDTSSTIITKGEPSGFRILKAYRDGGWNKGTLHPQTKYGGGMISIIATYAVPKRTNIIPRARARSRFIAPSSRNGLRNFGQHDSPGFWHPFLFSRNPFTHKAKNQAWPFRNILMHKAVDHENNSLPPPLSGLPKETNSKEDLFPTKSTIREAFQKFIEHGHDEQFFRRLLSGSAENKRGHHFNHMVRQDKAPESKPKHLFNETNLPSASSLSNESLKRQDEIISDRKISDDGTKNAERRIDTKGIAVVPNFGSPLNVKYTAAHGEANPVSGNSAGGYAHGRNRGQSHAQYKTATPALKNDQENTTIMPIDDSSALVTIKRGDYHLEDVNGKINVNKEGTVDLPNKSELTRPDEIDNAGVDKREKSDEEIQHNQMHVKEARHSSQPPFSDDNKIPTQSLPNRDIGEKRVRYIRDTRGRQNRNRSLAKMDVMGNQTSDKKTLTKPKNGSTKALEKDKEIAGVIVLFKDGTMKKSHLTKDGTMKKSHPTKAMDGKPKPKPKLAEIGRDGDKNKDREKTLPKAGIPLMHSVPKDDGGQALGSPSKNLMNDQEDHQRVFDRRVVLLSKRGKHGGNTPKMRPSKKVVVGIIGLGIFMSFAVLIACTVARIRNEEPGPRRINSRTALYENHRLY